MRGSGSGWGYQSGMWEVEVGRMWLTAWEGHMGMAPGGRGDCETRLTPGCTAPSLPWAFSGRQWARQRQRCL